MGNVPVQPSTRNLPKPGKGSELARLLEDAGFVWGDDEALDGGYTHLVTMPDGWRLQDVPKDDKEEYVNLNLLDPKGKIVASIKGTLASCTINIV